MAANDLPSLRPAVRKAHNAYIRAAASFRRGTSWGKSFSPAVLQHLESISGETLARPSYFSTQARTSYVDPLPDEVDFSTSIPEGAKYEITVNVYERNPKAKRRCKEHHGTSCCICGFSFGIAYGEEAEGYIHVHHLRALSEIGKKYKVDPIVDLRPVCPNCHAVIHLGGKCRRIEDVKVMLAQAKSGHDIPQ
jgi:5-methylcytosine-specific restriction protein A